MRYHSLRITKVITAGNDTFFAQWSFVPVGYIWNNTQYTGTTYQSWYNSTGRSVTFNYTIFNIKYDDAYSTPSGSLIYVSPTSTYYDGTCKVSVNGGTDGTTKTGTFSCPAGYYVCYFGQINSFGRITVWE